MAKATFGAGCFWGVEVAFRRMKGVADVAVGYAGGSSEQPTYEEVCAGASGHAEVVEIDYDPAQLSYDELLRTFWEIHDPTQLNRQGPDVGTQYRSAIFTHDAAQTAEAEASKAALEASGRCRAPIVTESTPAGPSGRAAADHPRYFEKQMARSGGRGMLGRMLRG
ncbi:MAG: peptide-methionine (S)-S-oxide reductase MsrA [bacterium]